MHLRAPTAIPKLTVATDSVASSTLAVAMKTWARSVVSTMPAADDLDQFFTAAPHDHVAGRAGGGGQHL